MLDVTFEGRESVATSSDPNTGLKAALEGTRTVAALTAFLHRTMSSLHHSVMSYCLDFIAALCSLFNHVKHV